MAKHTSQTLHTSLVVSQHPTFVSAHNQSTHHTSSNLHITSNATTKHTSTDSIYSSHSRIAVSSFSTSQTSLTSTSNSKHQSASHLQRRKQSFTSSMQHKLQSTSSSQAVSTCLCKQSSSFLLTSSKQHDALNSLRSQLQSNTHVRVRMSSRRTWIWSTMHSRLKEVKYDRKAWLNATESEQPENNGIMKLFDMTIKENSNEIKQFQYRLQITPLDCTGCGACVQAFPTSSTSKKQRTWINASQSQTVATSSTRRQSVAHNSSNHSSNRTVHAQDAVNQQLLSSLHNSMAINSTSQTQ